jgi:hypothetical protein
VCRIWWPRIESTGSARSKEGRGPPAKIEMLPDAARWQPPETGHSIAVAPLASTFAARRRISASSVVLISSQTLPGPRPSSRPSGPSTTAAEAAGEGRQVMTNSQASAIERGEFARRAPRATKSSTAD